MEISVTVGNRGLFVYADDNSRQPFSGGFNVADKAAYRADIGFENGRDAEGTCVGSGYPENSPRWYSDTLSSCRSGRSSRAYPSCGAVQRLLCCCRYFPGTAGPRCAGWRSSRYRGPIGTTGQDCRRSGHQLCRDCCRHQS